MSRRFPRFLADGFLLALIVVIAVATVFPARGVFGDALSVLVKIVIAALFVLYGARLSPTQAWHGLRHWRLHLLVLGATFVAFPLLGLAAAALVPTVLTPDLYTGVLFCCLVPSTVQSSIAFTSIARGNVPAAIVSASLSNMLGVVLTPLLVVLLIHPGADARIDGSAVLDIAVQLLLPFAVGQLIRPWLADRLLRHPRITHAFDRGSILLVVYAAFSFGMAEHIWSAVTPWRLAAMTAVCVVLLALMLAVTVGMGRLTRLNRADRTVLLFCGSKKSLASGLPMALVLFSHDTVGLIMLPLMLFHQVQLLACAAIATKLSRTPADVP